MSVGRENTTRIVRYLASKSIKFKIGTSKVSGLVPYPSYYTVRYIQCVAAKHVRLLLLLLLVLIVVLLVVIVVLIEHVLLRHTVHTYAPHP